MLWRHLKHKTVSRRPNCVSVYCLQLVSTFEDCGFALSNLSCGFLVVMSSSSSYKSNNSIGFLKILKCANWWLLLVGIYRLIYCTLPDRSLLLWLFSLWEEDDSLLQLGFRSFTQLRIGISGSLFWISQFYLSQWEEILNVTASMKVSDLQPWRHLDPQPISQHHEEEKASGPATNWPASWGRRKQNRTLKEKVKKTTKTQFKWGAGLLTLQQQQQQHVCYWLSITTSPLTR